MLKGLAQFILFVSHFSADRLSLGRSYHRRKSLKMHQCPPIYVHHENASRETVKMIIMKTFYDFLKVGKRSRRVTQMKEEKTKTSRNKKYCRIQITLFRLLCAHTWSSIVRSKWKSMHFSVSEKRVPWGRNPLHAEWQTKSSIFLFLSFFPSLALAPNKVQSSV